MHVIFFSKAQAALERLVFYFNEKSNIRQFMALTPVSPVFSEDCREDVL